MYEAKRDDYKRVEDESHTSLQQVIAHPALVGARTVQPAHPRIPVFYMQVQYPVHCCALVHPYQPWLLALAGEACVEFLDFKFLPLEFWSKIIFTHRIFVEYSQISQRRICYRSQNMRWWKTLR